MARHWLVATALIATAVVAHTAPVDWPTYNRTVTSERFVPLKEISVRTVQDLHILCSYDTKETTAFQSGLLQINGALYWTTEHDTFSVDPNTCQEKWRAHEDFPSAFLPVSRGAAFLDGRLFRGTNAGQVVAYDATSGKRLWRTTIADPKRGELVSASPIAWNGLVFIGNSGGDMKGVKGRMYALEQLGERSAVSDQRRRHVDELFPRPQGRPPLCPRRQSFAGFRQGLSQRAQPLHGIGRRP